MNLSEENAMEVMNMASELGKLRSEAAALRAENAELREALKAVTASLSMFVFNEGGTDALRASKTLFNAHAVLLKREG